jgi:DNA-binding SARP family transcriptional activator
MPKIQPHANSTETAFRAILAGVLDEAADSLDKLEAHWQLANAVKDGYLCVRIAATAINHIHHAWSTFAGLDRWIERLNRDLVHEKECSDAADKIRLHCAVIVSHHFGNAFFSDAASRKQRLKSAVDLLTGHGALLNINELFALARSLLDFIEIDNDADGFEAILLQLDARRNEANLSPLWHGRALVYGGRCYLRFNLQQKSKRFRNLALKLWAEARELARNHNLHTVQFDIAYAEMLDATTRGEIDAMPLLLADMEGALDTRRPMQVSEFFVQRAKLALYESDAQTAMTASADCLRYARLAEAPETQAGAHVLTRVWALALDAQYPAAREALAANIKAQSGRPKQILLCIDTFLSALEIRERTAPDAPVYLELLGGAFKDAAHLKWPNYLASLPKLASLISADALNANIEPAFVRATVTQRKLPAPAIDCAAWPWPIEVSTFGGFTLKRFGEFIQFEGKVQKKPLELLKCIVSVGRRGVSIHLVCEMLWPESDSEQSRTAFKVTLSRLRKLLDVPNAIDLTDTRVAINAGIVHVDCSRFEALAEALERFDTGPINRLAEGHHDSSLPACAERLFSIYTGRFLGDEPCNRWLQSARERWHSRFLRLVIHAGSLIEEQMSIDAALSLYQRAAEQDSTAEELHRRLIAAYMQQGEHAEATNAFRRLRHNLAQILGVMPSEKTLALVAGLGNIAEKSNLGQAPSGNVRLTS